MVTADTCWALDMLAAPRRERWAWVSARCALLESHLAELRLELQAALDGKRPPTAVSLRIQHLRDALHVVERKLLAFDEVQAPVSPRTCSAAELGP